MTDPTGLTATALSRAMAEGRLTAETGMAADLLAEACAADRSPRRGWMRGMPVAVKDLAAVRGLRTTWESPVFADLVPAADDLYVARMRAAGAIFIGKTNTPEWGLGSHSFNGVFGVAHNPMIRPGRRRR